MSSYTLEYGTYSSGLSLTYGDSLSITGGTATDTTLVGAVTNINSGLLEYTAMSGGSMEVSHDAFVQNTVMSGGTLYASGGRIENTTLEGGAYFSAAYNAAVTGTTVNSGGRVYTSANDFDDTVVNSGGRVDVYGGTANNFTVNASGSADFSNRTAFVNNLVINGTESYQYATVHASNYATVNSATVTGSYGYLNASGGATLSNVTLNDGGHFNLSAGGTTVDNVQINEGGSMTMSGNASMSEVSVNYGGWFSAGYGGYYGSYTIYEEDDLTRMGGAIRENGGAVYLGSTTIERWDSSLGGYVYSSGVAYPVEILPNSFREIVYSNGRQGTVHSNTVAYNITARWGGLTVYDGGIVTGYTVTPYTYDSAYERWQYHEHYNSETEDWEYTSEFVSGVETVTELGNLTVVAGGTVTGLVAQAMPGDEYSWNSYLNFEIAPNTLITGTIDGQSFMVQNGDMRPGSLKNANLTYMGGIIASGVTQINGNATFNEGVIASDMVFSGTSVTFNRGATVEFVRTAPMPYVYTEYEGGFGDQEEEPEETIVSSFMGAHVDVYAGAQVRSIEMTDKDYLHMQVAPNTVLTGTSGGVELNMTNGVFTSASLGSTYVEVMGGTTSIDETTAGTAVTIAGGTVTDLIVNPGACVSVAEGATALNLTENGGAVLLGWGNEIPATITYSINSNTFSYDHLVGGDHPITVHKNTSAIDNIMFGGELQVFSGGVVSNFYTVGSGMNMNMISLYEGAIVTNIDTVRYSDPGKYHPGQIEYNKNVTANVARLTDYDGITLFVCPDSVLTNGSVDNVPFSIENGVLSGFLGSDEGWFGDSIGIYRGAGMIDCRTDQWANVNIWQGGYGYNNTFADGYVYVGDTAYDDESEEGGIALLEKSTLGVAGNRDKSTTLYVQENGVVRDITVNSGSGIEISSGGKLTGKIRKNSNTINIGYGGYLDFDITAQDALTEARVDSLWNVTNDGRYSITIDGMNQAGGTYVLADSTYFNDIFFWKDNAVIYFDLMDVSGSTFGYFYMAEENQYHYDEETGDEWYESVVAINYVATSRELQPNFEFSLSEGRRASESPGAYYTTLLFTVDSNNVAPEWVVAPTVTADVITFTPSDVTLTAVFSEDSVTREYSLDGQIWTAFPTGGTTALIGEDGTPTRGGLRAVIPADEEEEPVVITGATLTVTTNGTYYFRGIRADGVVSDVTSYRVSNIDKVAPTAPTDLAAVATEDGVRLSWAESSDDYSGIRKYIVTYKEAGSERGITVETPYKFLDILNPVPDDSAVAGTVIPAADPSDYEWSVQAVDYAGNVSEATEFFNGIPGPVASASITTPTNSAVNVVIGSLNPDVAQYEYSLDDQKTWNKYDLEGLVISENITVWLRGITVDGVYTKTTFIKIDNIDLTPPDAPIPDASTQEPTNGYVIVTATFSNDSVTRECSIDGVNWVEYTSNGLSFVDNGFAYFRGIDAAGNISDVAVYEVSNIDKVPPTAPVASMTAAETFDGVIVTAVFSDDSVTKEYSLEGKRWIAYDGGVPVSELGTTVFFRSIDAAGNESDVTTFTVNSFTVGPEAPVASANITVPTNQNVTVTATFAEDAVVNQYSLNGGLDWFNYEGGIMFEDNSTVYFRSADAAGNFSAITVYTVDNIDKVAPEAPVAYADITELTNQNVTVYARFSDDFVVRNYAIVGEGGNWQIYTDEGVVLTANDTVLFAGNDAAGNYSEVTTFVVSNIDKIAPNAPVISLSAATGFEGVLVSAVFSDDSVTKEYSLDGEKWLAYADAVPVMDIGTTVFFRATDAAGNVSDVTQCTVDSFVLGPEAPVASADITAPTNQNVTVTATFDAAAALNQYSFNTMDWFTYDGSIVLEDNDVVYFRSLDAEGRSSSITTVTVDNIDKEGPNSPYAYASTTDWTNQDVTVYAVFSDDSVVRQYRLGSNLEEWFDYVDSTGVVLSENDSVVFRAFDAAGNESNVLTLFSVTNIDKVAPTAPTVSASAAVLPAGKGVDVTATFSDDSVKQEYSLDGRTWNQYNGPVLFTELGTAYFRGTDAAGNVSDVTKYEVTKLSLGPAAPFAFADITAPTNQDVTVYATFDDSAVVRRYAIDSLSSWYDYTDAGVVVSKNSKVYFACTNADGEGSDMTTFTVSNIDKVAPEKPVASASTTENTFEPVVVTATFSEDSVKRQYSYDGREGWYDYPEDGITFETNGYVYFRGIDAAGNVSNLTAIDVTNILEAEPDDAAADNGWNDVVYDKKAKELTEAAWEVHAYDLTEVYRFQTNAPTLKLQLDKFGSISENDMTNAVGGKRTENGKTVYDVDCMRIEMSVAGWVSLAVKATQAVKLSIIQVTWADDRVKMKTLQTTKVKADDFTLSKPLLIDPMNGEDSLYFVTVEGISPKKDGVAYYRVALDMGQSQIFFQADNSDDWTDLKENGDDSYEFRDLGMLEDYFDEIAGVDFSREDWVGYGSDNIDYCKFTLENNATLTFRVDAEDAVKFGIYTLAGKEGSYSLKNALKPTSTSSGSLEKTLQLEAGTYYFSVEANTKKVFDAAYNVEISGMIYDRADHDDDWTDLKTNGPDGLVYDAGTFTEDTIGTPLEEEGWVGFGDEIDYKVFRISGPAKLNFTIGADDAVKLTVYEVKRNKNGKWSLTAFNKNVATITAPKDGSDFYKEVSTGSIFLSDSNAIYAYSVQSTNARKGGSADYNVMLDSDGSGFIPVQKDPEGVDNSGLLIKTKGFHGGTVEIIDLEQWASDSLVVNGNIGYQGWVGYGDTVDTLGFSLTADTPIQSISIESTDQISVILSQVIRNGKSGYKTKKILSSTKLYAADPLYTGYSYALIWDGLDGTKKKTINLGAGDYIISIKSTNATKGGNASYKLTLGCEALQKVQNADALTDLSMPETSDALASSDDLSLGQFAETSSAISSAVTDALDDKLGSVMNASWTTLA